jgi:hypothetical protein
MFINLSVNNQFSTQVLKPKPMDYINEKIALLEDQIDNLERSGYFTEKEIDRLSSPLRFELENLQKINRG